MKIFSTLACAFTAAALLAGASAARAQTPLYTANTTTATPEANVVHFLQVINLAQGAGTYSVSQISIGINFTSASAEGLNFYFYSGVDTSSGSTNALASATYLGGITGNDSPPATGTYSFTYNLSSPITFTLTGTSAVGIEVQLVDSNGNYATGQNGRFTNSAPTVGSSSGIAYNDANLDNTFTGSEQTTFGMTNANIRMALGGTYAAPEPSTWACVVLGTAGLLVLVRRRRAA